MSISPGIWPSYSSALLTLTGIAPGPFASRRERLPAKESDTQAPTAAEDLSRVLLCKQEGSSPTLIHTADGGWDASVLKAV